jgi:hypothetical protein
MGQLRQNLPDMVAQLFLPLAGSAAAHQLVHVEGENELLPATLDDKSIDADLWIESLLDPGHSLDRDGASLLQLPNNEILSRQNVTGLKHPLPPPLLASLAWQRHSRSTPVSRTARREALR